MHIVLAALGAIVTILVLLNRLREAGIDIGWLNPFTWARRRAWRKKYEGNPIFKLSDPLEVAALLCTALAKIDGEISKEEKAVLLSLFQSEFGKTEREASDLLMACIYMFGDGEEALAKPVRILEPVLDDYSLEQAQSLSKLLNAIKEIDASNQKEKTDFVAAIDKQFAAKFDQQGVW